VPSWPSPAREDHLTLTTAGAVGDRTLRFDAAAELLQEILNRREEA
jgi:hypothetical protein